MKKLLAVFCLAFLLNLVWENAHAVLYLHYKGGPITEIILLHATTVDAVMITMLAAPFLFVERIKKYSWFIIPLALILAVSIEEWALLNGRWAYASTMPIVPLLGVGLTPTIQLALTGWLAYRFAAR